MLVGLESNAGTFQTRRISSILRVSQPSLGYIGLLLDPTRVLRYARKLTRNINFI
jgi:hypothetical protein